MTRALSLLAVCIVACPAALAQEPTVPPKPEPAQPETKPETQPETQPDAQQAVALPERSVAWTIKFPTEIGFATNLDNAPGEVTTSRIGADVEVEIPIATRSQLDLGFEYEYTRYDFDSATGFVAGASSPFRDVHREAFRFRYGQQQTLQLGWMVGGSIGFSGEDGADLSESVVGGLYGGVSYYLSRSLRVGMALGVLSRLEDDPLIVPIPVLTWDITEQWRMSNAGKLGLSMFFTPSEQWTLSLGGWYEERNFRLDDNGVIPGGVVRDSSVPLQLSATFRPTPTFSAEAGTGVRLFGNYEVRDSARNKVADIDSDPIPYVAFTLTVKF